MNYEKYLIELFEDVLKLMKKLHLTESELLELDFTKDGFDLQQLTEVIFNRHRKNRDTTFTYEGNILWIKCPYENDVFKSEMIDFLSNFPTYEIKFIKYVD